MSKFFNKKKYTKAFFKSSVILLCCVTCGAILNYLKIPAAWLLGSTLVSVIFSIKKLNITPIFQVKAFFSTMIGLTIASSVDSQSFYLIEEWFSSIILITCSVLFMWLINFISFKKQNYDTNTSLLASLPGGMSSTILLTDSIKCNKNLVILSQIVRYLTSIFLFPLFFFAFYLFDGNKANMIAKPFVLYPVLPQILLIVVVYIALLLSRKIYKFTPIIFAIFIGFFIYGTGIIDVKIDSLFRVLAQVFLGWFAGCQINMVNKEETKKMLFVSFKGALIAAFIAILFAFIGKYLLKINFMELLLALAPGGSDAMTFLALSFNLNVLFVSIHQILRIMILDLFIMVLGNIVTKKELKQKSST